MMEYKSLHHCSSQPRPFQDKSWRGSCGGVCDRNAYNVYKDEIDLRSSDALRRGRASTMYRGISLLSNMVVNSYPH